MPCPLYGGFVPLDRSAPLLPPQPLLLSMLLPLMPHRLRRHCCTVTVCSEYKHEKGYCSAKHSCLWSLLFRLTSPFSGLMYGGHFGGHQDMERQQLNVFRMRLLGAEVREVAAGTATLKDATSEAIRDWVTNVETTHYILGSAAGPHPYPMMVRVT